MAEGREAVNFQPIILQETKNLAFQPFTLGAVIALENAYMAILFDQDDGVLKGSLSRTGMEPQTMVKRPSNLFFTKKNQKLIRSRPLDRRHFFGAWHQVGCSFFLRHGFGLWA
jgi:hypothetical protein